jgi:hypothetical protein
MSWIDIVILGILALFLGAYLVVWFVYPIPAPSSPPASPPDVPERQLATNTVLEAVKAGLTVGGIVFPILVTLQSLALATGTGSTGILLSPVAIPSIRFTTVLIGLSLIAGVWNISRLPGKVSKPELLTYDKWTGFLGAIQLYTFAAGALRVLFFLVFSL